MRRLPTLLFLWLALVACSSGGDGSRPPPQAESTPRALLPGPRTEVAGASWQGLVVAAGGITADGTVSDRVDLYDPASNSWRPGPPLPQPLHHAGLAGLGDRLYVAGGYTGRDGGRWTPHPGVLSLGPGETAWRQEPNLREARGALALAAAGDRLVAIGGVTAAGVTRSTEVFLPQAAGWQAGPPLSQPREHFGAAFSGSRVYAIGGRVGSFETNMKSVESWDPTRSVGWREEPSLNDARGGASAAAVEGSPCIAGGEEVGGTIASVECLRDDRWEQVAVLSIPRHGLAVASLGRFLHVAGGGPRPGLSVSGAHEVFGLAGP